MADQEHTADFEVPQTEGRQALVDALLSELDAYRRELDGKHFAPELFREDVLTGVDLMANHIREWLREPQGRSCDGREF